MSHIMHNKWIRDKNIDKEQHLCGFSETKWTQCANDVVIWNMLMKSICWVGCSTFIRCLCFFFCHNSYMHKLLLCMWICNVLIITAFGCLQILYGLIIHNGATHQHAMTCSTKWYEFIMLCIMMHKTASCSMLIVDMNDNAVLRAVVGCRSSTMLLGKECDVLKSCRTQTKASGRSLYWDVNDDIYRFHLRWHPDLNSTIQNTKQQ